LAHNWNDQCPMTNDQRMTNDECPMAPTPNRLGRCYWSLGFGHSLVIGAWSLDIL
jgi:hypothetical protein